MSEQEMIDAFIAKNGVKHLKPSLRSLHEQIDTRRTREETKAAEALREGQPKGFTKRRRVVKY